MATYVPCLDIHEEFFIPDGKALFKSTVLLQRIALDQNGNKI